MPSNCAAREDSLASPELQGSNHSILKKSALNIHWKDWYWSWSSNTLVTWYKELTHWKRPWCWERLKAKGKGDGRGEIVRQHHRLNGHESDQTPGHGEGQGSLACCSPWGCKELDTTYWLNNNIIMICLTVNVPTILITCGHRVVFLSP